MKKLIPIVLASGALAVGTGVAFSNAGDPAGPTAHDYASAERLQLGHGPAGPPAALPVEYGSAILLQEGAGPAGAYRR